MSRVFLRSRPNSLSVLLATLFIAFSVLYGYSYIEPKLVAQRLYDEAMDCQAKGDIENAKLKLAEAVKSDYSFKDAKERLAILKRPVIDKERHISNEKSGSQTVPFSGYRLAGSKTEDGLEVKEYVDDSGKSKLPQITVTTRRYQNSADAADAAYSLRSDYSHNKQIIWAKGRMVYYGNDGKTTSLLVWSESSTVVEVRGEATDGSSGAALTAMKTFVK
jgi:hypothetical protein